MIPKGYKHTELGILPRHWEVVRLGDIGKIIGGGTPDTKNLKYWTQKNGIVWLTPTEIKTKYIMKSERQITEKGLEESSAKKLPIHTILITTRATIGDIGIAKVDCTTNQGFQSLVCSNSLNYEFAYYVLQTYQIKKYFIRFACGSTFLELSSREVRKTKIPLPPLAEQEKIAEILSTWDTQIQNLCSLIKDKQTLKKGLCQILLTAKTRFKGFDKDWEVVRLGDIFSILKGIGLTKDDIVPNGKLKCILYGELYTTYDEVIYKVISQTNLKLGTLSKKGDILVPASTTTSAIDIAIATSLEEEGILLGGDINIFRPKIRNICSAFIARLLREVYRNKIASFAQGTTIIHLYASNIQKIPIKLPLLTEQKKIAEVLSEADNEIKLLEQKLESLKSQKRGLMQKLLNGKVRVK
ncbi:restriction endonuclease subunit S [Helicobacter cholecystus]|uniref:Restriction endonuclease subunit S n=1 Tax=Helicobacter cholecystus TaxID=45498 RepID=A0A3D8IY22_9HELI|nr:restriction endonuclease subunit S [Helicobacter cholecystus]RDU69451.1 restriction endonuclease subunit S [Helicobacter cholecystus]VEJ24002.1 restriction modification system DNA specificity domain-containing protein [Helicobacter cholecystus]